MQDELGEIITACVVSDENNTCEKEIHSLCKLHFGKYKIPKKFVFVHELPMTSIGEIDKKSLAAMTWPKAFLLARNGNFIQIYSYNNRRKIP